MTTFDGCYFTIQALKIYHDLEQVLHGVELLVVDNHPKGCIDTRKAAAALGGRYIHAPQANGPAGAKDLVFREAKGEIVLCIDCHVLLHPNAINRVLRFFADPANDRNMLHGMLVYDDHKHFATHMTPTWGSHMLGQWDDKKDMRGQPGELGAVFEIEMHGMGLFAMKKEFWVGFNPLFRGFGGEEGYIHEKVRRAGGKVFCDTNLCWTHRFQRPKGTPYRNDLKDRFFNYLVGRLELNQDTSDLYEQFSDALSNRQMDQLKIDVDSAMSADTAATPLRKAPLPEPIPPRPQVKPAGGWPRAKPTPAKTKAPPDGDYEANINVKRTVDGDKNVQVRAEIKINGPSQPCAFDLSDVMVSPDGTRLSIGLKEVE